MDPTVVVLIADDEATMRDLLEVAFTDGGFAVMLASDGKEAIAALDGNPAIRALITDIKLGSQVTGWDVARHGREINHDLPVVYVTGSDGDDWASLGVPNSILILKPFATAQVLTAFPIC